jgi:hypothetical protein
MKTTLSKDLKVITSEIYEYDRKERNSVFEIGKRFKHVKENDLTHGQYTKWTKELGYTQRTVQRYIKVYERFGNTEEASNFRVSILFEMLSLNKSVDIKAFLFNKHEVKGKLKKFEQMTKVEIRDLVKKTNESIAPSKTSPASRSVKESLKFVEDFLERIRLFKPNDEELIKIIFDYFDVRLLRVFDLNSEQRKELLYCCRDESFEQELLVFLDFIESGWTHVQIKDHFLSLRKNA